MFLFILEGLGTSELLLILVVALIIFGPRKLPQLSRQLGKSLADFRRASEDFKQTWEKEVGRESAIHEALTGEAMLPEDRSILGDTGDRTQAVIEASEKAEEKISADSQASLQPSTDAATIARGSSATTATTTVVAPEPTAASRKRDWL
ncbi:MAG TPA: twin-arginine translocase TatA/TatE family subunit [Pyrinomonadaceae bacterium]